MRWFLGLVTVLGLGWCAWWGVGTTVTERGIGEWLADRREAGWVVNYDAVSTGGFPTRFDTEMTGIEIADPSTGIAFTAPRFDLQSAAYAPTNITAQFPTEFTVASPLQRLHALNGQLAARLSVAPSPKLTLRETEVSIADLAVTSTQGWTMALGAGTLTTAQADADFAHDIALNAERFAPADHVRVMFDPTGLLPATIDTLVLDTEITFDADWDIDALERRRPQPTNVVLRDVHAVWGGVELRVAGEFTVDANGVPEGDLTVKAVNWREILAVLQANGTLPENLGPFALAAVEALAGASGRPDTLDAPLSMGGGTLRLGPIPLGPTPVLRLR